MKPDRKSHEENDMTFVHPNRQILKKIGLKIYKDLGKQQRSVESFAADLGLARSTLREIIAGRSNVRILTLLCIVEGLGYSSFVEFFQDI